MLRIVLTATMALSLSAWAAGAQNAAGSAASAAADPSPATSTAPEAQQPPLNAHQRLSLGKSQLQQAAMRLQRAKDTGGTIPPDQVEQARSIAKAGLEQIDGALRELQQVGITDAAQQAIRNARLELQSAEQAVQDLEPDAPAITIQALKDLDHAASEVQDNAQLANKPEQPGSR